MGDLDLTAKTHREPAKANTEAAEVEAPAEASFSSRGAIPAVAGHSMVAQAASASDRAFGAAAASAHHIPGGQRNVDMAEVNVHHRSDGQASRIAIHGSTPVLHTASAVYGNDGTVLGNASPGPLKVNAGQVCHLVVENHKRLCVFTHGSQPGWVPVHHFERHQLLADLQREQHTRMDHGRGAHADLAHHGTAHTLVDSPMPSTFENLFVKPHQQSLNANHAQDYFVKGNGYCNLLVNLPTWTSEGGGVGERFGIGGDMVRTVAPGTQPGPESVFYQLHGPVHIPLFHHNSKHQAGHLTFVYGYVINNAGEKILGWMNQHQLAPH